MKYAAGDTVVLFNGRTVYITVVNFDEQKYYGNYADNQNETAEITEKEILMKIQDN